MKKINLTYKEFLILSSSIKSNDPLDSYRKGFLEFLDNLETIVEQQRKLATSVDELIFEVEVSTKLQDLLKGKLVENTSVSLFKKLS